MLRDTQTCIKSWFVQAGGATVAMLRKMAMYQPEQIQWWTQTESKDFETGENTVEISYT